MEGFTEEVKWFSQEPHWSKVIYPLPPTTSTLQKFLTIVCFWASQREQCPQFPVSSSQAEFSLEPNAPTTLCALLCELTMSPGMVGTSTWRGSQMPARNRSLTELVEDPSCSGFVHIPVSSPNSGIIALGDRSVSLHSLSCFLAVPFLWLFH